MPSSRPPRRFSQFNIFSLKNAKHDTSLCGELKETIIS